MAWDLLLWCDRGGFFAGFFVGGAVDSPVRAFLILLIRRRQAFTAGLKKNEGKNERNGHRSHRVKEFTMEGAALSAPKYWDTTARIPPR